MALLTYDDLAGKYDRFSDYTPENQATVTALMEVICKDIIPDGAYETQERTDRARLLCAAHWTILKVERTQKHGAGAVGQVTSRTESSGRTVSFSTVRAAEKDDDMYMGTTYGELYVEMKSSNRKGRLPSVSGMRRGRNRRLPGRYRGH